jgi:hypothetical protein
MRRLLLLPVLLASAGVASAAKNDSDYSTKETRALVHAYARCVVRQQPAKASEAIAANVDNGTILRRYPMLLVEPCLNREVREDVSVRFTGDLYGYALADALVNREFAERAPPDFAGLPPLVHRDPREPSQVTASGKPVGRRKYEAARKEYQREVAYAFLSRYGECVVRLDGSGARALLLTRPDTPEETARFASLKPVLEECLPPGRTLRFGRVTLRGLIAVNFYRLAHAAQTAAGGTSSAREGTA